MKGRTYSMLLFLICFSLSGLAQAPQQTGQLEQNLRKHIEYLASDKLEGRRTGEPGATSAAHYVADQFGKLKLKPGSNSGNSKSTFLQPFPYISGVTLGADNSLQIVPANSTSENKMEVGVNWMPLGYSPNADIAPTNIVFAGFGVTAPEANYDDYKDLDVKDKIVLIFDNTPDAGNPHSAFSRFDIHTKANIAKDKGAKAIILIAADNDFKNDRLAKLTYDRTLGETAVRVVGIARASAARSLSVDVAYLADIESLRSRSKEIRISTTQIPARPGGTQTETNPPVKVTTEMMMAGTATIRINLVKKQVDAYNVIGILPGTDSQLKNEAIIIGAHYDHLGHGGSGSLAANSTEIHHGADDNASGTSAVIELARQFAKEKTNKRTLLFMAFSGEEEGLLGSKYYVNNPVWPIEKTIAMINMDMVGRLNENKLTVGGVGTAGEWKAIVARDNMWAIDPSEVKILSDPGIAGSGDHAPGKPQPIRSATAETFTLQLNEDGFGPSDHSSFYGKKIPVLFFFTGTHIDYHKPSDTADKINYEGLERITNYVGVIARSIDENPARPT